MSKTLDLVINRVMPTYTMKQLTRFLKGNACPLADDDNRYYPSHYPFAPHIEVGILRRLKANPKRPVAQLVRARD